MNKVINGKDRIFLGTRNGYKKVCEISHFSWACFNVFEKVL